MIVHYKNKQTNPFWPCVCVWVCVYWPAAKSQSSLALSRDAGHRSQTLLLLHTHTHIRLDQHIHTFPFALMRVWHNTHQSQSGCARFRAFLSALIGWRFRTLEELLASPFCYTLLNKNNCELSSPFCVISSHWNVISVFTKSKMSFLSSPPCA